MKLHPAQQIIVRDNHRFRIVNAGRRFGKTVLAVEELVYGAVNNDGGNVAYVAPTYGQAREISWELLKKRVQDVENPIINETRLEMVIPNKFGTTSKIALKGWESVESLRGQAYDFLVLDEVAMYRNFTSEWQEVIRPTLTDRRGKVLFISTPKGFNFWYDLYGMEAKDSDYKSFHFTTYDNPFIPKDEIDKQKQELTEDRFSQEINADFRKTEGLVYKEFDRAKHIYTDEVFNKVSYFAGIDSGFTNPTAVIFINKDTDNKFYVSREWYKTGKTDEEVAEFVSGCGFNCVYPDPEAPAFIESLRKRGVNTREVVKGKDSIRNGISIIRELFKQNRLFIHSSCENLIWELETYSYPDKKDMHNEEENPIKENDHALDALRYALSMQVAQSDAKANIFVPHHQPIITPYSIPQQNQVNKTFYPKR